jgi:PIN domain nuclease of toxin-antitoxin system
MGVLLDTHTLYWLVTSADVMSDAALVTIADAQSNKVLFVSPISAWELAIAAAKPAHKNPTTYGDASAGTWFSAAIRAIGAKVVPVGQRIACLAAEVAVDTDHRDPGDCYLIATARHRKLPIVSRDGVMLKLAALDYLQVIRC